MSRPITLIGTLSAGNRRLAARWLSSVVLAAVCVSAPAAFAGPPSGQVVHTSRPKFRIPFQFNAEEMARLGAVQIQLFVSSDRGRHWQHAQSVSPAESRFTYEAKAEGEYWFAVRTLDNGNQLHPLGPPQSGLEVVVDQTDPQLELRLRQSGANEVELSWRATDSHLDANSLKLEFLDATTNAWQPVNVTAVDAGRTTWRVPQGGRVFVRGSVSDRAGNSSTADTSTTIEAGRVQPATDPQPQQRPATPDFNQPVAGPVREENGHLAANPSQPVMVPWETRGSSTPAVLPIPGEVGTTPRVVSGPTQAPFGPVPDPTPSAAASNASTSPTRYVQSTQFNVNYELEQVGPSGVSSVDLYITENNGFKWFHYGSDDDRASPVAVEVPGDGSYGFAFRVRSGVGLVQEPPQPGEPPTLVVVVDRTPPQGEITSVRPAQANSHEQIDIEWTARDERLGEKPIRLHSAPQPVGPWQPITDWMENAGRYRWNVGPQWRQPVYLRVEVRDAAGNTSHDDTKSPLVLDLSRPSARITDVESLSPAGSPQ